MSRLKGRIKKIFLCAGVLSVCILLYLFCPPLGVISDGTQKDIQASIIRYIYKTTYGDNKDYICFVGICKSSSPDDFPLDVASPEWLFTYLKDLPSPLAKIQEIKRKPFGDITDSKGRFGAVILAGKIEQKTFSIVKAEAVFFAGGLCASGYNIYLLKTPFGWLIIRTRISWNA